ncbi:unnamed protein product [Timema podura]|uniref:Coiled-coil domain-containing protein 12 n=1 Tax=Timema podura TaxID=61482 RepID=A0ABN7NHG1_TIMPD|nr:unnamed protein product [Timema podura]
MTSLSQLASIDGFVTLTNKMSSDNKVGFLEEEAIKRKERLKVLKRKHDDVSSGEIQKPSTEITNSLPKPKFRSYRPLDESLKENVIPDAHPGNVDDEVKDQLEAANSRVVIEELDITNLAPRKPDWDLKRDVAKKLERLERRTQKAIAELIRDRLKKGQEDFATSVDAGARANQELDVDED